MSETKPLGARIWDKTNLLLPVEIFEEMKHLDISFKELDDIINSYVEWRNKAFGINIGHGCVKLTAFDMEFAFSVTNDFQIWNSNGMTTIGHCKIDTNSPPTKEFIDWLYRIIDDYSHNILHCSDCGKPLPEGKYAGRYLPVCFAKIVGKENGEPLKQQRITNNGGIIMTDKERFISLCSSIKRDGIDDLMNWLEHSDFYTAPASSRFHLCCEGGLLQHSLHVYDELKRLLTVYPEIKVSEETVLITSLFHDLCKVNCYKAEDKSKLNILTGRVEQHTSYTRKEELHYGGHGSKSVYLIQKFINLTDEEAVAINCHMSCWDGDKSVGDAFAQFPFAWLLHVADESATYLKES